MPPILFRFCAGRGRRIRTFECRNQNPVPWASLATPLQILGQHMNADDAGCILRLFTKKCRQSVGKALNIRSACSSDTCAKAADPDPVKRNSGNSSKSLATVGLTNFATGSKSLRPSFIHSLGELTLSRIDILKDFESLVKRGCEKISGVL